MKKIGLTGGIASGKSKAAEYFSKLGIPIIDADLIAKQLTSLNTLPYKKIVAHFGKEICKLDNELDRKLLRNIIFTNFKERRWLEKLLHPLIYKQVCNQLKKLSSCGVPFCIIIIPLLFETKVSGFRKIIDRILVIDAEEKIQIERLKKRDKIDAKTAKIILKSQINRKTRLQKADDVIYNNGSLAELKKQVKMIYKKSKSTGMCCKKCI